MSNFDLDIDLLRCFITVAQTKNFTKAGEIIGLTQSGVSVKIKRLEDRIGSPVFNRTSKTLSLTLEGEILLGYARKILRTHDEAVHRLCETQVTGELKVGLVDYFIPNILPSLLNRFRQHYPDLRLQIRSGLGLDLIPLFEHGELDLVVAGKDEFQKEAHTIVREPLVWAIGTGYDLTETGIVHLALLPAPCSFRKIATELLDKQNRDWEILYTGTSIPSVIAAVQSGMGISALPLSALSSTVRQVPHEYGLPELPMSSLSLFADYSTKETVKRIFADYLQLELEKTWSTQGCPHADETKNTL